MIFLVFAVVNMLQIVIIVIVIVVISNSNSSSSSSSSNSSILFLERTYSLIRHSVILFTLNLSRLMKSKLFTS